MVTARKQRSRAEATFLESVKELLQVVVKDLADVKAVVEHMYCAQSHCDSAYLDPAWYNYSLCDFGSTSGVIEATLGQAAEFTNEGVLQLPTETTCPAPPLTKEYLLKYRCLEAKLKANNESPHVEAMLNYLQPIVSTEHNSDVGRTPLDLDASVFEPISGYDVSGPSYLHWCPVSSSRHVFVAEGSPMNDELRTEAATVIQRHARYRFSDRSSTYTQYSRCTSVEDGVDSCKSHEPGPANAILGDGPWVVVDEASKTFPELAEKWTRYINVVEQLPEEAFSCTQRPWLAKLFSDHIGYSSLSLCIADGLVRSRAVLLEELEKEMRIELSDEQDDQDAEDSEDA